MDWIEQNKFLTGWIVTTVVGCLILGLLLFKAKGGYEEDYGSFVGLKDQIFELENKPLYPSKENLEKKAEAVEVYQKSVDALHAELAVFQRPLREVEQTKFQAKLKGRIQQVVKEARRRGVSLPDGFSFGMPGYVNALPSMEACPLLDYQLDAISSLCAVLIEKGVVSIESIDRSELSVEVPESGPGKKVQATEEKPIIERFPFEIVIKTKPDGLREFLNVISNPVPGKPFHIVRFVRIANEKQVGPLRSPMRLNNPSVPVEDDDMFAQEEPLENETDTNSDTAESQFSEVFPLSEEPSLGENAGAEPIDSEFIMGKEKIEVYMKIELLRFQLPVVKKDTDPEEASNAAAP